MQHWVFTTVKWINPSSGFHINLSLLAVPHWPFWLPLINFSFTIIASELRGIWLYLGGIYVYFKIRRKYYVASTVNFNKLYNLHISFYLLDNENYFKKYYKALYKTTSSHNIWLEHLIILKRYDDNIFLSISIYLML